ncbi:MAG: IS4 family transposase, partial [Rhodobacteraceae bacterium]|nr:IS4 family transposase [Paracoccaceae bacterium]
MLDVKSASVMELGHGLPIKTTDSLSRFQWIKRFLGNDLVDVDGVVGAFSREVLALASAGGAQPV